ncbi:DDE-type integrase/transposase/recombinase [Bradyrhizobium quebecense]|uniref:DDE-type integrase/transposase/recombinase n=1 Tax=Bradyrhizobium quebecense TaxID=2748629 RepID=A0A973WP95_9BRAD|nr:DDE-type integrase/transposase/recombinase [Bradyrhizobium quebecense]UGA47227.1 DDE-type integrase/transposase/recombinase [Bradyrhizobium quebecense]
MNKLDRKTRAQILHLLCEGQSIRAITRLIGASKNTVAKLLVDAGHACAAYQDKTLRNLTCKRVQMDEIWSFVYAKAANVKGAKAAPASAGDVWTWTAIDADTKLIVSWLLGARDLDAAMTFTHDLESRLANRVQITSDGHAPYLQAVDAAFAGEVDYAMLIKLYGAAPEAEVRYSPAKCIGARKEPKSGNPEWKHISTSYAERSNLTMRMHMRRFTRLTNAFSKKVENHAAAIALHTMYYNFVRIHQTLKVTPAMAAGVTDKLWEMGDLVAMLEQWELANFKPEYQFVVRRYAIGKGCSVSVVWRGGEIDTVFGFESEADAMTWIKEKSQEWLINYKKSG